MDQLSDEEVEVRGEEDEEEEDSDKEDQDLDKMFGAWLGELDKLTQVSDRRCFHTSRYHTPAHAQSSSSVCFRAWMMVAPSNPPSRKLPSDRRPTWLTSPTDSPSTTSTVRHTHVNTHTHTHTRVHVNTHTRVHVVHLKLTSCPPSVCRGAESGRERGPRRSHG